MRVSTFNYRPAFGRTTPSQTILLELPAVNCSNSSTFCSRLFRTPKRRPMRSSKLIGWLSLLVFSGMVLSLGARAAMTSRPEIYDDLRNQALHTSAAALGLPPIDGKMSVYGVIMDMGLQRGTATLVGFSTGDGSLYLSSGGGIIGGGGHASVRQSARAWVESAEAHQGAFTLTTTFERPTNGQTRFFILTNHGTLTATELTEKLDRENPELSPVWKAGQKLLTDLRLCVDKPAD